MSYVDDTALELARKALAEAAESGNAKIVDQIGEMLGASSQSLQESYQTMVRVLRAEERARELLAAAAAKRAAGVIWAQADYFLVPLLDGQFALGQVVETDGVPQDCVFCLLSSRTLSARSPEEPVPPIDRSEITALCFMRTGFLADGTWPLAGFDQLPKTSDRYHFAVERSLGFKDMPIHEPAVIEAFLNAWHGLYDWTAFGPLFDQIAANGIARDRDGA